MLYRHTVFLRICARPVTPIPSGQLLKGQLYQAPRSRSFASSGARHVSPASNQESWVNVTKPVRPSAIWLVPEGSTFDEKLLIDQLPAVKYSAADLPVSLFFVTPKLVHLFQDGSTFHSRVINTIYQGSTAETPRQSVVAVVDALPVIGGVMRPKKPEMEGCEGIAMSVLPSIEVQNAKRDDKDLPIISMTGEKHEATGDQSVSVSFSGRVANTTFVNGWQSTMYLQQWQKSDDQQWTARREVQHLHHIDIPLYSTVAEDRWPAFLNAKMTRLTDPKVILFSMGNIVRSMKTADGKELAASHELEEIVPRMLKERQKELPNADVRVFALVYPPELGEEVPFTDLIRGSSDSAPNRERLMTLLINGARLYRVTSGGAGWGKKAGLLSLEPATELTTSTDDASEPSFIFEDDQDIRMPGSADLFPPGHIVQFLATFHDFEGLQKLSLSIKNLRKSIGRSRFMAETWLDPYHLQQFCVGSTVLPETHQHTSIIKVGNVTGSGTDGGNGAPESQQIFCPARFGFLTTSALSISTTADPYKFKGKQISRSRKETDSPIIRHKEQRPSHSSLVELPNSYFLARFAAGGIASRKLSHHGAGTRRILQMKRELAQHEHLPDETLVELSPQHTARPVAAFRRIGSVPPRPTLESAQNTTVVYSQAGTSKLIRHVPESEPHPDPSTPSQQVAQPVPAPVKVRLKDLRLKFLRKKIINARVRLVQAKQPERPRRRIISRLIRETSTYDPTVVRQIPAGPTKTPVEYAKVESDSSIFWKGDRDVEVVQSLTKGLLESEREGSGDGGHGKGKKG